MKYYTYSFKLKLKLVNEYLSDDPTFTSLAKKHGMSSSSIIQTWVRLYEQYGK
ncbi:helix-turn-helix domain-containing protein, partial [Alkalibacterium sp. 20]|uniref:helix-turn-helix domain-containing protein n=1 Tax=Alkalibacterium sp. 20 TaxID=1798803 RepID=UPI000B26D0A5